MTKSGTRSSYEGVAKIIRFNSRFYIASAVGLTGSVLVLILVSLPIWLRSGVTLGATLMVFWTLSSIVVSWYVYDHTGVMRWEWMGPSLPSTPQRWANIHAGLDESTAWLRRLLPGTNGVVVDIYDPHTMTEPSIAKARQMYPATEPFQAASAEALPLPDADRDAIFLLFAAHELRTCERRTRLLREAHRVLRADGKIVLVEHLRDFPNFLAFGPGFLHFHARRSWSRSIHDAGLRVVQQRAVTPFVQCFTLCKADV
jgi:ubiquinone/menaquinone biosynthesis C-methylase UbiE